jgi:hypothetical protein
LEPTCPMPLSSYTEVPLLSRLQFLMDQPTPPEGAVFPRTLECLLLHDRRFIGRNGKWQEDPRFITVGRSWVHPRGLGPLELQWEYQWFDGINEGPGFWVDASEFIEISVCRN